MPLQAWLALTPVGRPRRPATLSTIFLPTRLAAPPVIGAVVGKVGFGSVGCVTGDVMVMLFVASPTLPALSANVTLTVGDPALGKV